MDGGQIVLIGNESDVLHSGYNYAIKESDKRYPSVNHYAHCQILLRLGLDESILLDLLCANTRDVATTARNLLLSNMPTGHDLNSLSSFLSTSFHSYTMQGLRIRVQQDKAFERNLMDTNGALLIVCDSKDRELGIGMEEQAFAEWMSRERVDAQQIAYWMRNEIGRPANLGANQLGYFLMWLRHEVREAKMARMLTATAHDVDGISKDQNEKIVKIKVNDLVISLTGVFRPLSNYFPMRFEMKGDTYRSVEHYAYEKLFISLKLDDKCIEKINTTVLPVDVPIVAQRLFNKLNIPQSSIDSKLSKMDRWRQSAMKHKLVNNDYLQQLLLSTGDALLIDNADGDPAWTCGASEGEMQRLMAKEYIDAKKIVGWMREKEDKVPKNLRCLGGNKTGLLLMELRSRLAGPSTSRIPLISPMDLSLLSSQVSPHVICFTAESVWHPLYPAEIAPPNGQPLLPSPAHYVAQQAIKFLSLNKPEAEYIMEEKSSVVCWQRLHEIIESRASDMEKDTQWWMVKRQAAIREALTLLLEQHPPLLRALLDTHDALIIYCGRFSSVEAELAIGMRESDLRAWMQHVQLDTKQLMELCNRPLAFRPPYLGGNRLGIILMELRREFILRGVFPSTLPDLNIGSEAILGSDSPTEAMLTGVPFDVMASENYTDIFINACLLLGKETKNPDILAAANRRKSEPRMVSLDEEQITAIVDDIEAMAGKIDHTYISECAPAHLRGVFLTIIGRLRKKMVESDLQQAEMNYVAREVSQMQFQRRKLEVFKMGPPRNEMNGGGDIGGPPMMIIQPSNGMTHLPPPPMMLMHGIRRDRSPGRRAMAGGDRDGHHRYDNGHHGRPTLPGPVLRRRSPENRKVRGDLIPSSTSSSSSRRPLSPSSSSRRRDYDRSPSYNKRRRSPSPTPNTNEVTKTAVVEPTKPKVKVPRPADEELSDGEILSSDED